MHPFALLNHSIAIMLFSTILSIILIGTNFKSALALPIPREYKARSYANHPHHIPPVAIPTQNASPKHSRPKVVTDPERKRPDFELFQTMIKKGARKLVRPNLPPFKHREMGPVAVSRKVASRRHKEIQTTIKKNAGSSVQPHRLSLKSRQMEPVAVSRKVDYRRHKEIQTTIMKNAGSSVQPHRPSLKSRQMKPVAVSRKVDYRRHKEIQTTIMRNARRSDQSDQSDQPSLKPRQLELAAVSRKVDYRRHIDLPHPPFTLAYGPFPPKELSRRGLSPRKELSRRDTDEFDLDYTPEVPVTDSPVIPDPVQDSVVDTNIDPDIPPTPETPPSTPDVVDNGDSIIATVLPDNLGFPKTGSTPNYSLSRVLYGTGILYYKCKLPSEGGDAGLWAYSSTEAGLYQDSGYTIRIGQVSCNSISAENASPGTCIWSIDNSQDSVTAKLVKSVPAPSSLDADWTRSDTLKKENASEAGVFGDVRTVFTVATVGGKPPQMIPCNESNSGEKLMIDFYAEYQFYSHL